MDLTKIPKFLIWFGIAVFVLFLLYIGYSIIQYKIMKPYERYFVSDCYYSNGSSLIIITAKTDLSNINVTNIDMSDFCLIKKLNKDSMEACKIKNEEIDGKVLVKVIFTYDNTTYSAIVPCKIEEKKGLLSWLLGK